MLVWHIITLQQQLQVLSRSHAIAFHPNEDTSSFHIRLVYLWKAKFMYRLGFRLLFSLFRICASWKSCLACSLLNIIPNGADFSSARLLCCCSLPFIVFHWKEVEILRPPTDKNENSFHILCDAAVTGIQMGFTFRAFCAMKTIITRNPLGERRTKDK